MKPHIKDISYCMRKGHGHPVSRSEMTKMLLMMERRGSGFVLIAKKKRWIGGPKNGVASERDKQICDYEILEVT